ncbi:hypothetical protein [Methylotetracoccus oryzae]|uniref:hypothetical protein n=1 Tax=Methylotetracoccus oryzae TaxID=1919059 RepID=UPI001119B3CB|nr:hypothetical protein [Methylotetracoccus oryzae]
MKTEHPQLATAVWEADRHFEVLTEALQDWDRLPAQSLAELEADRGKTRLVDQLLFRFTKLQDALGQRLVPATLAALAEPNDAWPMRDRLNRVEKLGYLDVDDWMRWRETRNRLAHEYPDKDDLRFAVMRAAIDAGRELAQCYDAWRSKLGA